MGSIQCVATIPSLSAINIRSSIISSMTEKYDKAIKEMSIFRSEKIKARRLVYEGNGVVKTVIDKKDLDSFTRVLKSTKKSLEELYLAIEGCRSFSEDFCEADGRDFNGAIEWYRKAQKEVNISGQSWMKVYSLCNKTPPIPCYKFAINS